MKTDLQIQKDVMSQLEWEPLLNASEIGVSVKDGVVTLSGIVDTYFKKITAEKAVKKVAGVKAVAEDIQVGLSPMYKKTDTEIAATVLDVLKLHTAVIQDRIKIKVEDALVTLEGNVEWDYQRKMAERAVEGLPGVRDVLNLIIVAPPSASGSQIKNNITEAFHRHATIDSEKILIELSGSKVILKGTVRSLAEKDDAEEAAWSAPGVSLVENRLLVDEEVFAF